MPYDRDYLELPLHLEDYDDDDATRTSIDLWAHIKDSDDERIVVMRDVTSAVRYQGWWHITHKIADYIDATALIPSSELVWFDIVERQK